MVLKVIFNTTQPNWSIEGNIEAKNQVLRKPPEVIKMELRRYMVCSLCYSFKKLSSNTYQTQLNNNVKLDTDSRQKPNSATEIEFRGTSGEV